MFGGLNTRTKLAPVRVNGKITVSSLLLREQAILQFPRLTQFRGFRHMIEGFLSCGRRKKSYPTHDVTIMSRVFAWRIPTLYALLGRMS